MASGLDGKVAIVTGASSGIGLAAAEALTRAGCRVALVARTKEKLDEIARRLPGAIAFPLDVTDLDELLLLPEIVQKAMGRLDIVIHNAGVNHRGSIAIHPARALLEILATNLTAPIALTRAAHPIIERGGAMVFVASIAGMVPVPGEATYSASKAGVRAFARAVAEDFEAKGVHVAIVSPGPVDTNFFGDIDSVPDIVFSQPMSTSEEIADAIMKAIVDKIDDIAVPARSGRLANAAYLMPGFAKRVRPALEKRGKQNKRAYIEKKRKGLS